MSFPVKISNTLRDLDAHHTLALESKDPRDALAAMQKTAKKLAQECADYNADITYAEMRERNQRDYDAVAAARVAE